MATHSSAPGFLPGKFHGHRSLVGYRLWGRKETDMTKATLQNQLYIPLYDYKCQPSSKCKTALNCKFKFPSVAQFGTHLFVRPESLHLSSNLALGGLLRSKFFDWVSRVLTAAQVCLFQVFRKDRTKVF